MDVGKLLGARPTPRSLSLMDVEDEMREEDMQRNDNRTGWTTEAPLALKL